MLSGFAARAADGGEEGANAASVIYKRYKLSEEKSFKVQDHVVMRLNPL